MIKLHPFAISELLMTITYLPLFLLIFIKGKSKLAKIYSLHMLTVEPFSERDRGHAPR